MPTETSDHSEIAPAPTGPKLPWWHLHRRLYDWVLSWANSRYGGIALFVLSFAESSCFPVPPDVLLAPLVLGNRRKWFRFALSCSIASVLGGTAGYLIGFGAWEVVDNFFFDHIPGFSRDAIVLTDGKHLSGIVETPGDATHPWQVRLPSNQIVSVPDDQIKDLPQEAGTETDRSAELAKDIHYGTYSKVREKYNTYNFWVVFTAGFTPLPYKVITITAGVFQINFMVFLIASAVSRSARFFLVAGLFWLFGPVVKPFIDKYFNLLCLLFVVLLIGGFVVLKYV